MGREIKFRAWLKKENRMLDKVALTWPGSEMIIQWYDSLDDYYAGALSDCSERDAEVMQYTGLKDKNGREIYEGDITKDEFDRVAIISWKENEARFSMRYIGQKTDYRMFISHLKSEIIGNIYENPELINPAPIQTDTQAAEVR